MKNLGNFHASSSPSSPIGEPHAHFGNIRRPLGARRHVALEVKKLAQQALTEAVETDDKNEHEREASARFPKVGFVFVGALDALEIHAEVRGEERKREEDDGDASE